MILGSQKFRIGVVRMEICLDVIDCLISGTNDIFSGVVGVLTS